MWQSTEELFHTAVVAVVVVVWVVVVVDVQLSGDIRCKLISPSVGRRRSQLETRPSDRPFARHHIQNACSHAHTVNKLSRTGLV